LLTFTIELVIGYILAETTFFIIAYTTQVFSGEHIKNLYESVIIFHWVCVIGLMTVLLSKQGALVALWGVWSELVSIFLGIESFLELTAIHKTHPIYYNVFGLFITLIFIIQRFAVFLWLVILALLYFQLNVFYTLQTIVLFAALIANSFATYDRIINTPIVGKPALKRE